jgi:VCBS repeat-containing protein
MTQIGTVKSITGVARAVAVDGTTRVLVLGDPIYEGETINTIGAGSNIDLNFNSGRDLVLSGDEKALIDQSVYAKEGFDNTDVTAAQQAILDGGNLPTAAAAAGQQGPDGAGGFTQAYDAIRGDARGDVSTHNLGTDGLNSGVPLALQEGQVNLAPTAVNDTGVAVEEGSGGEGQYNAPVVAAGNILANDTDDGLPNPAGNLDVSDVTSGNTANTAVLGADGNYTLTGEYGTLVLNADTGDYTYTVDDTNPTVNAQNIGDTLNENFTYTVTDGLLDDTANLSITINGANDAPIAVDDGANLNINIDAQVSDLSPLLDNGGADGQDYSNPTGGSATKFIVDAASGEEVSFDWSFDTSDYSPYNDFAFVVVDGHPITLLSDIAIVGSYGNSGTQTFSFTFSSSGSHTITFGVLDTGDTAVDSFLNISNINASILDVETLGSVDHTGDHWSLVTDGASASQIDNFLDTNMTIGDAIIAHEQGMGDAELGQFNAAIAATGNVLDNDTDVDNAHDQLSVTNVDGTVVATTGDTTINGLYGTLTMHADGSFSYSAHDSNPTVDGLNIGESLTDTFTYTVSDNEEFGAKTDTANLTITIDGTDDAPVISTGDTDMTFVSESAGFNNVLGVYTFDENGNPTNPHIVITGTNDHSNLGVSHELGLPMGSFGLFLISNGESAYHNISTASVSFDLSGATPVLLIDGVASSKPVSFDNNNWNSGGHDHFDTTINSDGSLTISIEDLNMGDNDRADLVVNLHAIGGSVGGTVVEITDGAPGENHTDISTLGILNFNDVDFHDAHTVTHTDNDAGYIGTFTSSLVTEAAGEVEGKIDWSFTVPDSLVDHMGADESIVQTYTVTVEDSYGKTDTQEIAITIQGTNDRPVAFADHGTTSENAPLTIDVLANDTDADTNDTISIHSFDTTTSGGGTISLVDGKLVFDPGHDFDHLGVEQSVDVTFSYQAQDDSLYMTPGSVTASHGISDPTTVTITITGTNDAPIAHADYNLAAVDTNYYQADFNPSNLHNHITESAAAKVLISAEAGDTLSFDWSFDQKGGWFFNPADVAYVIVDNNITKLAQGFDKSNTFTLANLSAGEHVISVVVSDRYNTYNDSTLDITNFTTTATVLETTYASGSKIADITDGIRLTAGDVSRSDLNNFLETHETLPYAYPTQGNVLNNDTDIDNNHANLSVTSVNGHPIPSDGLITTSEGVLHISSDGSYEYTPNVAGSTLIVSFNYEVSDGDGGTDTSTLYITTPHVDSVIMGDVNDNPIFGTDGSDAIFGGDGNDTIDAGNGDDYISGGYGNDNIDGGHGADIILGGEGDDIIVHDTNDAFVDGGSGTDTLIINTNTLDLSNVHNIEVVQLNGGVNLGDASNQLTAQDVFDMTSADVSGNHELTITGVAGSDVTINTDNTSGDATFTLDTSNTSSIVDVYSATLTDGTTVTLNIEQDLNVIV